MNLKSVKLIIAFVVAALFALIGVQLFWAYYSFKLSEKTFQTNVHEAMRKSTTEMNDFLTCFELFSKTRIDRREGFYMLRRKANKEDFDLTQPPDTIPMFFEHAQGPMPFQWNDIKFGAPVNLEMILKFEYVFSDTLPGIHDFHNTEGLTPRNFREKLSDKHPIYKRFDPLDFDSLLHHHLVPYGITDPFRFGYLQSGTKQFDFISDKADSVKLLLSPLRMQLTNNKYFSVPYDVAVYFPNYQALVFSGIKTMLISSLFVIFILLISFYLFIRIIFRQRKLSAMKNDFINNMTHEFKTPLANISVALETLINREEEGGKESYKKLFQIIGQETGRLNENVEKILQVARFEKEEIQMNFEIVDMEQVIRKAVSSFDALLSGNGVSINFDFRAKNSELEGDETHLINVVCNLVDNAIKYSANGHADILISSRNTEKEFVFCLKDSGKGMSKEVQKKIFERFYRESNGDTHDVKGFGLGLSYVHSIIVSHHGSIHVNSVPGKGSEFEVRLPFKQ